MEILICGLSGSGKSGVAEIVAKKLNLRLIHTSGILRQLFEKKIEEIDLQKGLKNKGFWESNQGKNLNKQRLEGITAKGKSVDEVLDEKLLQEIEKGNVVMDSWTMPWLSRKGLKVWLKTSDKIRGKRLAKRDGLSEKEVMKRVKEKEKQVAKIYKKLYGFDFGKDLKVFDLIIDVDPLTVEETAEKIIEFVKKNSGTRTSKIFKVVWMLIQCLRL